MKTFMIA